MGHDQDDEADDDDIGNAEMIAGDPGLVAAFGIPQRDRPLLRRHQCRAEEHTAHRQRRDEGGDLQLHMGDAREEPGEDADADGEPEGAISELRNRERHDDAGERRHRLERQVDAAEHDDEGDPGRENEQNRRVAGQLQQGRGLEEHRLHHADDGHEDDEGCKRQPLPQPVDVQSLERRIHRHLHHVSDEIDLARLVAGALHPSGG